MKKLATPGWRRRRLSPGQRTPADHPTRSRDRETRPWTLLSRASRSSRPQTGRTVGSAARLLCYGAQELHQPRRVRHRVLHPHTKREASACRPCHLEEEERVVEEGGGAEDVENELVEARERRLRVVAGLVEADVAVGLREQHALAGAVHGELASIELPQPACERVVMHQRPAGHVRRLASTAAGSSSRQPASRRRKKLQVYYGDMEAQAVVVIDFRDPLQLLRRRPCRRHQLRRLPAHRELQGRRRSRARHAM